MEIVYYLFVAYFIASMIGLHIAVRTITNLRIEKDYAYRTAKALFKALGEYKKAVNIQNRLNGDTKPNKYENKEDLGGN